MPIEGQRGNGAFVAGKNSYASWTGKRWEENDRGKGWLRKRQEHEKKRKTLCESKGVRSMNVCVCVCVCVRVCLMRVIRQTVWAFRLTRSNRIDHAKRNRLNCNEACRDTIDIELWRSKVWKLPIENVGEAAFRLNQTIKVSVKWEKKQRVRQT